MCREALATTMPSSIELLDPVTDASRSLASLASSQSRSSIFHTPSPHLLQASPSPQTISRRHFFINSPNSLAQSSPKIKMPSPKEILYANPAPAPVLASATYDPTNNALLNSDFGMESARTPRSDLSDIGGIKAFAGMKPMQVSATNETSVATTVTDSTKTTKTMNVASTISQTVSVKGRTKIITTKKEQIITEKIEIDEL